MKNFYAKVYNLLNSKEEGATMVEYGLMVALIAVACIGAVQLLAGGVQGVFGAATTALTPTAP